MSGTISWLHVDDLHMDEADGMISHARLAEIVAPADCRMVTRPADPRHVPRPGDVEIVAKVFGAAPAERVCLVAGDATEAEMTPMAGSLWCATVPLTAGLNRIGVTAGQDRDTVDVLVRPADDVPRRAPAIAPGRDIHAIGAWPEHGIEGMQLGPNKNSARL